LVDYLRELGVATVQYLGVKLGIQHTKEIKMQKKNKNKVVLAFFIRTFNDSGRKRSKVTKISGSSDSCTKRKCLPSGMISISVTKIKPG